MKWHERCHRLIVKMADGYRGGEKAKDERGIWVAGFMYIKR